MSHKNKGLGMPFNKANGQRGKWRSLGMKKDTDNSEKAEKWYNCNMCNYRVKMEITLKMHTNRKHIRNDIR